MSDVPAKPVVLNMLLCDAAHRDSSSGKWSLMGVFSSLTARQLPAVHPSLSVYLSFAAVQGTLPLQLQILPVNGKDPIASITAQVQFATRDAIADIAIPINGLKIVEPGLYRVQLLIAGQLACERPLMVGAVANPATPQPVAGGQ